MEDVFHSGSFAMEPTIVSMAQMSLLAVEVSIIKYKNNYKLKYQQA